MGCWATREVPPFALAPTEVEVDIHRSILEFQLSLLYLICISFTCVQMAEKDLNKISFDVKKK